MGEAEDGQDDYHLYILLARGFINPPWSGFRYLAQLHTSALVIVIVVVLRCNDAVNK